MPDMLAEVLGGVTAMLVAFGAGIRWMISWSDAKVARVQEQLETQYTARFAALEARLADQAREVQDYRKELSKYIRHVGKLEGLLSANDISIPRMGTQDDVP